MERYTIFLDRKNQYGKNYNTTQSSLQIQCNHCQITNGIFHRLRTKIFTICARVLSRFICVRLFVTLWTLACQALLSMGLSRQDYWSGLPYPSPGNLPDPGIESLSLMFSEIAGGFCACLFVFTTTVTWEATKKQSTNSMQFLSNYRWQFSQIRTRKQLQFVWKHKRPSITKEIFFS